MSKSEINIAAASFKLPDGRLVLNRRGKAAPVSPGLLAFYGGHVDPGEQPIDALKREIEEETSLKVKDLKIKFIKDFNVLEVDQKRFFLYEVKVPTANFEVFEGEGSEVYSVEAARQRKDLTPSLKHALTEIIRD